MTTRHSELQIRPARPNDASGMLEIYAPIVEQTAISFELEAPSVAEFAGRIERYTQSHAWLVALDGTRIAGYAYASAHRSRAAYRYSVETSVYLHPDHRGKGLATRLYGQLLGTLADSGYAHAFAGITVPNQPSETLHQRLGFSRIGVFEKVGYKFDGWHDVSWWQRPLGDESQTE